MALSSGTRVGPYEIQSAIGAGGMGEVYRARDTKLGRDVALKVLPQQMADDTERLARLHREAQVLASLNHPNIAAIYGFEDDEGTHALILELVEGETLADRIARGPLPIDEAPPIARQIAEALEAAHERGVIHRDLKPANVKVRADGSVKVLDFGLAKISEAGGTGDGGVGALSLSPTITSPAMMTGAGVLLGTAAYMAPEQAKGRPADKRSDLWAFGCVLYEMLTGKRPFAGEDVADTLAAVLMRDPDWSALPSNTPVSVQKLLRRCLQKDRKRRLADPADARLEIEEAVEQPAASVAHVAPSSTRRSRSTALAWVVAAVALVVAAILAVAFLLSRQTPPDAGAIRFQMSLPDGWYLAQTSAPPSGSPAMPLAISPDGRRLAFVGRRSESGQFQIWLRSLDALSAQPVPGTEGAASPFWSPDGRYSDFLLQES
jgi:serine/threonine protein kinase